MKIRRFIPDFISQTGNTQVAIIPDFPNDSQASSSLGPFTVSSSTKIDTRKSKSYCFKSRNIFCSKLEIRNFRLDIQPDGRREGQR